MQVVPLEPARRLHGDGGSAIVEAAFLTPVLMFFLLGVFESAFVFLDYLTAGNVVRAGVRTGAIVGNSWDADYQILQSIRKAGVALKSGDLQKVVIFEATGSTSTVPATCAAGTASNTTPKCNVYSGSQLTAAVTNTAVFGCDNTPPAASAADRFYCPTRVNRKTALTNNAGQNWGPPGWFGVYVEVKHTYITKIFGSSITIKAEAVSRFEPETLL